ncbi:MAG: hypothetical protein ACRETQ_13115 [Gammaproteobacteria bacterium]
MMKLFGVALALLAGALAGCSTLSCGDPHPYLDSKSHAPLQAPAGLSVPPLDQAYAIAGTASVSAKRTDLAATGACLINPPQVVPLPGKGNAKTTVSAKAPPAAPVPASKPESPVKPPNGQATPAPAVATSNLVP